STPRNWYDPGRDMPKSVESNVTSLSYVETGLFASSSAVTVKSARLSAGCNGSITRLDGLICKRNFVAFGGSGVGVIVGVRVRVAVRVGVGVEVGVRVDVGVRVRVAVPVLVRVAVRVAVDVKVGVKDGVAV